LSIKIKTRPVNFNLKARAAAAFYKIMKSFSLKLFIIFILNFTAPISSGFIFPDNPIFISLSLDTDANLA
jgi:hypothetical protein